MKKPEATERGHVQGLQSTAQLFKPPQPRCQTCGQVSFQMVPDPSIESLPAFESSQPKLQVCGPEDKPLYWETIQTSDPQNPRVHEIASRELLWEKATVGQGNTTKIGAIQTRWESQLTLLRLPSFSSLSLGDWHKSRWTCVTFIHSFAISVNKAGTEKTSAQNSLAAWGTNTDVPCPGDFSHLSWGQPREKPHSQAIANPDHLGIQTEHTHTHHATLTDSHWPDDLFSSIHFPEKQSWPQTEALISHLPQILFHFDLGEYPAIPQYGPLDNWSVTQVQRLSTNSAGRCLDWADTQEWLWYSRGSGLFLHSPPLMWSSTFTGGHWETYLFSSPLRASVSEHLLSQEKPIL